MKQLSGWNGGVSTKPVTTRAGSFVGHFSAQALKEKGWFSIVEILVLLDVPGGFTPITVAAPGTMSLEKASTRVRSME